MLFAKDSAVITNRFRAVVEITDRKGLRNTKSVYLEYTRKKLA